MGCTDYNGENLWNYDPPKPKPPSAKKLKRQKKIAKLSAKRQKLLKKIHKLNEKNWLDV